MINFDFDMLQTEVEHEWQHRGRTKRALPEPLLQALHNSYSNQSTACLPIQTDDLNSFKHILNKAGIELNYRIHKEIKEDQPAPGYSLVYFKVVGRRRQIN